LIARLLADAQKDGACNPDLALNEVLLMTRAFGYALARRASDVHAAEWHPSEPVAEVVPKALRLFMSLLAPKTRRQAHGVSSKNWCGVRGRSRC
jgi:hypothetical protein